MEKHFTDLPLKHIAFIQRHRKNCSAPLCPAKLTKRGYADLIFMQTPVASLF